MPTPLRILLVEDRETDAELLVRELRRAGFDAEWRRVDTEPDFLARLDPSLDIILADYSLPVFSGVRALELLQQRGLDIPLILVSGTIGEEIAVDAIKRGAADYLMKDRLARLAQAIEHALEQRRLRIERRQRERELAAIAAIATGLRTVGTRAEMMSTILDQAQNLLQAEGASLSLIDPDTDEAVVEMARGRWTPAVGLRTPKGVGLTHHVLATGQVYVSADARAEPLVAYPDLLDDLTTIACAPLIANGQALGVLWAGRRTLFADGEVQLLTAIADIAASALHRASVLETLEQRVVERTRELAEANERLKELDRLKSKFVSDVSHELRTPVSNLRLYVDLLDHGKPEKRDHYLLTLREQSQRLARLVEDILDLSRLERETDRAPDDWVDLNRVVDSVVTAHQPRSEAAGLALTFEPADDLPAVRGDGNQLAQVTTNLIANAIAYTPSGEVRVRTRRLAGEVCLEVRDTGIGIVEEDLPHLFERFYRGRRPNHADIPGTGLGLSIVKEIVNLHQGRIEVESEAGVGSTFRVWLPIEP